MTRLTSQRKIVLAYIAQNPGCSTADVDRACRTARGGHQWMYALVARLRRAGLVHYCQARPESRLGGARGLDLTMMGAKLIGIDAVAA